MLKVLFPLCICLLVAQARENPFFPLQGEEDLPFTSNKDRTLAPLNSASISLPSSARVIKKVSITYENLDASRETKDILLNNSIDWHLPVFISQTYKNIPDKTTTLVKSKDIKKRKNIFKKIASIKHASFFVSNKSLKIVTSDTILRNFLLAQPHRIVIDFKKDSAFKSYMQAVKNSVFTKIRVGNHDGYYRVVIELDGYYRYKMKKQEDGYLLLLS